MNQTFQDWTCVISDDASNDKSVEIAREYENKDKRFKVIRYEENVGAADNWNRSKDNNTSFATKLLCADDYLLDDALGQQLDLLKKYKTSIVFSERFILFPNGKRLRPKLPIYSDQLTFNEAFYQYIKAGRNIFGEPVAALFRTKDLLESDGFISKFEYALDTSGYMSIARNSIVTFDNNVVGVFRVSRDQWSHQLRKKQFSNVFDFIDHLVNVEGVQVTATWLVLGKIKAMGANLVRVILYRFLRDK